MTSPKDKPSLQELADTGVLKAQASRFATRVPLLFDRVCNEILRSIPGNPNAAAELEVLVSEAERGRAWRPAMGTAWDTADQAAPR